MCIYILYIYHASHKDSTHSTRKHDDKNGAAWLWPHSTKRMHRLKIPRYSKIFQGFPPLRTRHRAAHASAVCCQSLTSSGCDGAEWCPKSAWEKPPNQLSQRSQLVANLQICTLPSVISCHFYAAHHYTRHTLFNESNSFSVPENSTAAAFLATVDVALLSVPERATDLWWKSFAARNP